PLLDGPALLGGTPGGRLATPVAEVLRRIGAHALIMPRDHLREAATVAGVTTTVWAPEQNGDSRFAAALFDATGISSPEELRELYDFFGPVIRRVRRSGRIVV